MVRQSEVLLNSMEGVIEQVAKSVWPKTTVHLGPRLGCIKLRSCSILGDGADVNYRI